MADEDEQFEKLLDEFVLEYRRRTRSLEAHMDAAKRKLESETEGLRHSMNVRHMPISSRLKDEAKALRTLRRRQEDRKQLQSLREMVEARGFETWEQYCRQWGMADKVHESEPFLSVEQMFAAMHDLAGIRVSIYFPTDVQKVVDFLRDHFHIVEGPSQKGGLTRDMQKVRRLVERQRQIHSAAADEERGALEGRAQGLQAGPGLDLTFSGYRATHVVICHKSLDFDQHARGEDVVNIEVQIGSIIMHAWSDIEHDILYKPSETGEPSADVVRMLDLINGIVMTGEVALQQLASVAAAETARQAEDRKKTAVDWPYMLPWFDKYFADRNIFVPPRKNQWMSPQYLFEILRATGEHTYGRVEQLLDGMRAKPEEHLSVLLLQHLGRDTYPFQDLPSSQLPQNYATTWNARYWATCLVNTFNLASFMNSFPWMYWTIKEHWGDEENRPVYPYRPTFAEFLDILHPTKPQRRFDREPWMVLFCKRVLVGTPFDPQSHRHVTAALRLASAGYVARPRLSEEEEEALSSLDEPPPVFVPAMLKRLAIDPHLTFKVALSAIRDGLRDDEHHYFIPRRASNDDRAWRPVRRDPGNRWVITRTPFTSDESLVFEDDKLGRSSWLEHLIRVLDIEIDVEELRALHELANNPRVGLNGDEMWVLLQNTRALGTADPDTYLQFVKLRDELGLSGAEALVLAELAGSMGTLDAEELQEYRNLAYEHGTMDPDELRALQSTKLQYRFHDDEPEV